LAGKLDTFLKLSIIASVFMASASVGYYYLVYLPRRDAQLDFQYQMERKAVEVEKRQERARAEAEKEAEQQRLRLEEQAREERQAAEKAGAQQRYQQCIKIARSDYETSWAAECKRIAIEVRKADPTCTLPRKIGADLTDRLHQEVDRCLQENKAGLTSVETKRP